MNSKFEAITQQLIKLLEQGVNPWQKPWGNYSIPRNVTTGKNYGGNNPWILSIQAWAMGLTSPWYITFNQAKGLGWKIMKGSKASSVCFAGYVNKEDEETGEEKSYRTFKWFSVFSLDQIDDSKGKISKEEQIAKWGLQSNPDEKVGKAEAFIAKLGAKIEHGHGKAAYSPTLDRIILPRFEDFSSKEGYYATLVHELVHWTGHESRLNRNLKGGFGSETYAFEELVAEIGSWGICEELGISSQVENHASYIESWLRVLKGNPGKLQEAAKLASQAEKFLTGNIKG